MEQDSEHTAAPRPAMLLESVTDAVLALDSQWTYTFVNQTAERFLGRERHELIGRSCWELFPEFRTKSSALTLIEVMQTRKSASWRVVSAMTGLWVQWRAYPTADGGVSVFIENIDERVQTKQALLASDERFRTLANLVPAFICTSDRYGKGQWRNQRWLAYVGSRVGVSQEEVDLDSIHPEDRQESLRLLAEALQTGQPLRREHRLRRADGVYRWCLLLNQPILDEHGEVTQWVGVALDIQEQRDMLEAERTARAEAEAARRTAERAGEHLRSILAAIPTAIAVTVGPDHVFELVNPAYETLVGGRQVEGLSARSMVNRGASSSFIDALDRVRLTGEAATLLERPVIYDRLGDGMPYEGYFSSFMAPLRSADGHVRGVITSCLEVTDQVQQRARIERLRLEAEGARTQLEEGRAELEERILARTAELARTNEALAAEIQTRELAETARRELLRQLATAREDEQRRHARDLHDQVGQTLSALMLAIQTACDAEPLPAAAAVRLGDALRLAETLARDVHDLATRLRPAALDDIGLHAALRQLVCDWTRRYGRPIAFQAAGLQRQRLPADIETLLFRVVQEALTNVARHAKAHHVTVIVERPAGFAVAVVEDDGVGFDVNTVPAGRLGIMGMRERVTLAGGTLEIESTPNAGTVIIASVPVAAHEGEQAPLLEPEQLHD